jgi:hypothetical protein
MRSSSFSTRGACSSNAPPSCLSRALSQAIRPGKLRGRDEREALVVDLEQGPLLVQEAVGHVPPGVGHARREHAWFRPAVSIGSNWIEPRRYNTARTPSAPQAMTGVARGNGGSRDSGGRPRRRSSAAPRRRVVRGRCSRPRRHRNGRSSVDCASESDDRVLAAEHGLGLSVCRKGSDCGDRRPAHWPGNLATLLARANKNR